MHYLPIWFLVLSLFLPRLSLLFAYYTSGLPFVPHMTALPEFLIALLIPRVLILIMIYNEQGFQSGWFILHAVFMVLAYLGGSTTTSSSSKSK